MNGVRLDDSYDLSYDPPSPRLRPIPINEGQVLASSVPILVAVMVGLSGPPGDVAHDPPPGTPALEIRDNNVAKVEFEDLPPEIAEEVKRIEAEHSDILSGPVESWRLEPIRHRYEFLSQRNPSPAAKDAIKRRLANVARHEEMAKSAEMFDRILQASRRRDKQVAATRRVLSELEKPQRRPYVAEGLIQPSSRQVDGHRVFALIGTEGRPIAYLDVPPGLDARPVLAKRVGVRGSVHYDENLGAKLIAVRDIESLE